MNFKSMGSWNLFKNFFLKKIFENFHDQKYGYMKIGVFRQKNTTGTGT